MARVKAKNPTIEFVAIELQGNAYRLAFDYNSIALAEEHAGINMLRAFGFENLDARQIRAMLWACLLPAQPEMTLEDAGRLITFDKIPEIAKQVAEAWFKSIPENPQKPVPAK